MRRTTRFPRFLLLPALALLIGTSTVVAAGVISTTGATIQAGSAPIQGHVVIDADAPPALRPVLPALWAPPDIGEMEAAPVAPDFGDGSEGELTVSNDRPLEAGTYHLESLTIENGAEVQCTGEVVLLVQGDCLIDGAIRTFGAGEPITVRCGGNFRLAGTVETVMEGSPIEISAGGDMEFGVEGDSDPSSRTLVSTFGSAVSVTAHGSPETGGGDLTVHNTFFNAYGGCLEEGGAIDGGGISVRAGGDMTLTDARIDNGGAPVRVQAFGDLLSFRTGCNIRGGEKTVQSNGRIEIDDTGIGTVGSPIVVKAFGGDIRMTGSYVGSTAGSVTIQALDAVEVLEASKVGTTGSKVEIFGDSIRVVSDPSFPSLGPGRDPGVTSTGGHVTLHAESDLTIEGSEVRVGTTSSPVDLQCHAGPLTIASDAHVTSTTGPIDVRAGGRIETGAGTELKGGGLSVSSGPGGMHLRGTVYSRHREELEILSSGTIRVESGDVMGTGVHIASTHGDVDVSGADIHTGWYDDEEQGLTASADVLIEAWQPGSLIADGATIQSGSHQVRSGSVWLLLHRAEGAEQPKGLALSGFLLPRAVKVRMSQRRPERCRLTATGFLDVGRGVIGRQATVEIGGLTLLAEVRASRRERVYRMRGDGLKIRLRRLSANGSRFRFRLRLTGELKDKLDPDAELMVRIRSGNVEATGEMALQGGVYRLGAKAGTLFRPDVFPVRVRAALGDAGQDRLRLRAGFATTAELPTRAPDVEIGLADLDLTVPADEFETIRPGVFSARASVAASWSGTLTLDFVRGRLVLNARGIDLGEIAGGDITLSVAFDGEPRAVRVVAVRSGGRIRY